MRDYHANLKNSVYKGILRCKLDVLSLHLILALPVRQRSFHVYMEFDKNRTGKV